MRVNIQYFYRLFIGIHRRETRDYSTEDFPLVGNLLPGYIFLNTIYSEYLLPPEVLDIQFSKIICKDLHP
jgi:hypothetical protein